MLLLAKIDTAQHIHGVPRPAFLYGAVWWHSICGRIGSWLHLLERRHSAGVGVPLCRCAGCYAMKILADSPIVSCTRSLKMREGSVLPSVTFYLQCFSGKILKLLPRLRFLHLNCGSPSLSFGSALFSGLKLSTILRLCVCVCCVCRNY